jgi:hypothetical protein
MKPEEIVTVKVQRPFVTNGNKYEVLSYIVDENDEQISNPYVSLMKRKETKKLFGKHYKVYYLAYHQDGQPVKLFAPTRQEDWV